MGEFLAAVPCSNGVIAVLNPAQSRQACVLGQWVSRITIKELCSTSVSSRPRWLVTETPIEETDDISERRSRNEHSRGNMNHEQRIKSFCD